LAVDESQRTYEHPLYQHVERMPGVSVALGNIDQLLTWGSANSLWIFPMATSCCGIEFMAAAQALDFREFTHGRGVQAAHEVIRSHVDHLDEDRPLYPDHNVMDELVKSGEILERVEQEVGSLG